MPRFDKVWSFILLTGSIVSLATLARAEPAGFELEMLPAGAEITLPQPATVLVKIDQGVVISSTDFPQSLSMLRIDPNGGELSVIEVEIFDRNQDVVRNIDLQAKAPFIYNMKKLSSVFIKPILKTAGKKAPTATYIQIESDKPITIKR